MTAGTWNIRAGSIAAAQYATAPDGRQYFACGMRDAPAGFIVEWYPVGNMRRDVSADIPLAVRAEVARRFGVVFSLPYAERGPYLHGVQPCAIEVPEGETDAKA
jgi:hypothetical protein